MNKRIKTFIAAGTLLLGAYSIDSSAQPAAEAPAPAAEAPAPAVVAPVPAMAPVPAAVTSAAVALQDTIVGIVKALDPTVVYISVPQPPATQKVKTIDITLGEIVCAGLVTTPFIVLIAWGVRRRRFGDALKIMFILVMAGSVAAGTTGLLSPAPEQEEANTMPQTNPAPDAQDEPSAPNRETAVGSGFIIRADGYVMTNAHVILLPDGQPAQTINVTLSNRKTLPAKVIGFDKGLDLAVIKVDVTGLPVAQPSTHKPRVGDFAIAIGHPLNLDHTVTFGIVSHVNRSVADIEDMLQIDAAINKGNSGGPLFNIYGEVIGINSDVLGNNAGSYGFAIPMDVAIAKANQIIDHGTASNALAGIKMTDNDQAHPGEIVIGEAGGPSDKILQPQDIIKQIDHQPVSSAAEVKHIVNTHAAGDVIVVQVLRNGQLVDVSVTLGEKPQKN